MKTPFVVIIFVFVIASCSVNHESKSVFILIDTTDTQKIEMDRVRALVIEFLKIMKSTDTFAVAGINTGHFSDHNIAARVTLNQRPILATNQKLAFYQKVDQFLKTVKMGEQTDIYGALIKSAEYMSRIDSEKNMIIIFSDLKENRNTYGPIKAQTSLKGVYVTALNVTRLRNHKDEINPYLKRAEVWRERVGKLGGQWRVIDRLDRIGNKELIDTLIENDGK